MSWPTFSVTVLKVTQKPPHAVELRLTRCSPILELDLWPDVALRVLADPAGSPLQDRPLYDDAWLAAHASEFIGDVVLLSCKGDSATYQIPLHSDALAALLQKGQTWETRHYPTRWPLPLDGAWTTDEKAVLIALDSGVARLIGVTKKGAGSTKALLHHPGLVTVDASDSALLTAGRTQVVRWDTAGKKALRTHTLASPVVSARFLGDRIAAGCADGAVLLLGADDSRTVLAAPGAHGGGVVALAAGADRLAAAFAGGVLCVWDAHSGAVLDTQADTGAVALAYNAGGTLVVGRADHSIQAGAAGAVSLPKVTRHQLYSAAFHPGREELLVASGGRVSAILRDGTAQELLETVGAYDLQFSPSGRYRVARGTDPDGFYLWDDAGRLRWRLSGPISLIRQHHRPALVVFSPDERWVVLQRRDRSHANGALLVLETAGGGSIALPNANTSYAWIEGAVWLDDDRLLVSYANEPDKVWRLSTRQYEIVEANNFSAQLDHVDGGVAYCAPHSFEPDVFQLLDPADLSVRATFPLQGLFESSYPPTMQMARSGRLALLSNFFQDILLVTPDGEPWQLTGTATTFNDVQLSPTGKWMVILRKSKQLEVWDVARRTCVQTVPLDYARLLFSADEQDLYCVEGLRVRKLRLSDGTFSVVHASEPGARPLAPISAVQRLPDGRLCGLCGRILLAVGPRGTGTLRYGGWTCISPSQSQLMALTDRGPEIALIRML